MTEWLESSDTNDNNTEVSEEMTTEIKDMVNTEDITDLTEQTEEISDCSNHTENIIEDFDDISDLQLDDETEIPVFDDDLPMTEEKPEVTDPIEPVECELQNPINSEVHYFGQRYRTDDNGDLYMRYDNEKRTWELLPDTKYKSSGYYYETDENGSITRAGGTLRENVEGRKSLNANLEGLQEGDDGSRKQEIRTSFHQLCFLRTEVFHHEGCSL